MMTIEDLDEFERNFNGHYDSNYELAEWCRLTVPDLIDALRHLLDKKDKPDG